MQPYRSQVETCRAPCADCGTSRVPKSRVGYRRREKTDTIHGLMSTARTDLTASTQLADEMTAGKPPATAPDQVAVVLCACSHATYYRHPSAAPGPGRRLRDLACPRIGRHIDDGRRHRTAVRLPDLTELRQGVITPQQAAPTQCAADAAASKVFPGLLRGGEAPWDRTR